MNFQQVEFEMSAGVSSQLPRADVPEIVFSGKSNVGKSSLINKLVNRKALARVSATPGKTTTINFFRLPQARLVDLPGYVEGPWLHKRGDLYYLTYASMGEGRENISYATAPSMEGPWKYRGELTGMAENSFTIHPGIIEFNGKWYLFYHNAALTLDGHKGAIGRRSVCVDELTYNYDGEMNPVVQTKTGVAER